MGFNSLISYQMDYILFAGLAAVFLAAAFLLSPLRRRAVINRRFYGFLGVLLVMGWFLTQWLGTVGYRFDQIQVGAVSDVIRENLMVKKTFSDGLVVTMSGSPLFESLSRNPRQRRENAINLALDRYNRSLKGAVCFVMDIDGLTVGSSNRHQRDSFVGKNYGFRPYFREAVKGGKGRYIAVGVTSQLPGYYTSAPVLDGRGTIIGVAVIKIDIGSELKTAALMKQPFMLVDTSGYVLASTEGKLSGKFLWPADHTATDTDMTSRHLPPVTADVVLPAIPSDGSLLSMNNQTLLFSRRPSGMEGVDVVAFYPPQDRRNWRLAGMLMTASGMLLYVLMSLYWAQSRESRREIMLSEEKYRAVVENTSDAIIIIDPAERIVHWSGGAERMFGYRPEELLMQPVTILVPEELMDERRGVMDRLREQGLVTRYETVRIAKDGRRVPVDMTLSVMKSHDGSFAGISGIIRDMTERKKAEEAFLDSERNMRMFFNTISHMLFVLDTGGTIIRVNAAVNSRLGYKSDELLGQSVFVIHPEDRRDEAGRVVADMVAGKVDVSLIPLVTKDGFLIPVETQVKKGIWSGEEVLFGVSKDLSRIQASEEKFSRIFHTNPTPMAISSLEEGRFLDANEAFLDILEYERREVIGRTSIEIGFFANAGQRAEVKKNLQDKGSIRDLDISVLTKSGHLRHGLFSADLIRFQDRQVILAVMKDITLRKQMEEALRESETRYRFLAENSGDVAFIIGLDMKTQYVSPSVERVLGYTPEERLGQTPEEQLTPDSLRIASEALLQEISREETGNLYPDGVRTLELAYYHRNGTVRILETVFRFLRDERGTPVSVYGVSRDVTERKRMEEERLRMIHDLEEALAHVKRLSGLLPICSSCKKIRDDQGYWQQVERFVSEHSEVQFSHSICPDCIEMLYPDLVKAGKKDPEEA